MFIYNIKKCYFNNKKTTEKTSRKKRDGAINMSN